ncbi:uncharacterized protein LOC119690065 [Teleopsis dalmanni]|uniref:uncharacterized protein LOC119690065 n=1 Tax=Teleopsis dalmanni TaxID=139649 RepID=UPI0018CEDBD4|nr:uncharacterized protein LOC119690065 [Teleopsis dalmanni]
MEYSTKVSVKGISVDDDNVVLAITPSGQMIAIKTDYEKPKLFISESARLEWEWADRKEAEYIKYKLEIGEIKHEIVKDRVIVCEKFGVEIPVEFTLEDKKRKRLLKSEYRFNDICSRLRVYASLDQAKTDLCLRALKSLKNLQLNRLIVLLNPGCVDTIRRLRKYVGNLKSWKLRVTQERKVIAHAATIRNLAITIYDSFKKMFNFNGEKPFWDEYSEYVQIFQEATKKIRQGYLTIVTEDIYQKLLAKHKAIGRNTAMKTKDQHSQRLVQPIPSIAERYAITQGLAQQNQTIFIPHQLHCLDEDALSGWYMPPYEPHMPTTFTGILSIQQPPTS